MLEHHPAGSCQFPGDSSDGDNAIRFSLFLFIKTLRQWLKAYCKMCCFRKSSGEIFVACFGITFSFLFAIAGTCTVYTATIGNKVSCTGKTMNIARFQLKVGLVVKLTTKKRSIMGFNARQSSQQ
jgi:hypothetical protein